MSGEHQHVIGPGVEVDEGMRRWYDACSCCLGDAYPEVKEMLDAERIANSEPLPKAICEEMDS